MIAHLENVFSLPSSYMLIFAMGLMMGFMFLVKSMIKKLTDPWSRLAYMHSWRQWLHFEFWPGWFFYIPVVPMYLFLSVRFRSLWMPFYAAPGLDHGGLIGESKWDLLKHLDPAETSTLRSALIPSPLSADGVSRVQKELDLDFPFILKPDVGQRGFGVRIIRNTKECESYINSSNFNLIIQELSSYSGEAGIFYVRRPSDSHGDVLSLTDKEFPSVRGDGKTSLGHLILRDRRARIIAAVYFERHKDLLSHVLADGETFLLSECGNHCQGAVFKNGNHLITPQLIQAVDRIARKIPDFYFGRFDVRYRSLEELKLGRGFEIVEVNGSGSEFTHIWDARTKLSDAYRTLYAQWRTLFEIGAEVNRLYPGRSRVEFWSFLRECLRVFTREHKLKRSS